MGLRLTEQSGSTHVGSEVRITSGTLKPDSVNNRTPIREEGDCEEVYD